MTNFGKKGRDWARKNNIQIEDEHIGVIGSDAKFSVASNEALKWVRRFLDGTYDEVYVIFSQFVNMATQQLL